jgi:predicted glycoside hydrolase/deacetylase ChbG (UPF0249 family)
MAKKTPGMNFRGIVLCADDYGLAPGVSSAIRHLLEKRRITATSCMVVFPEFRTDGAVLRAYRDHADIGLHFTLTAKRPLGAVMSDAYLGRLDPSEIATEIRRQTDEFTSVVGTPPDYIDGHQHVHLLPVVREAVADMAARIGAYVRITCEPITAKMMHRPSPFESVFLSWSSRPLARLAAKAGIPTNHGFRGTRNFLERASFRNLFQSMIADATRGTLIICHPGWVDSELQQRDRVTRTREEEFVYLAGNKLSEDLANAGLCVMRLRETLRI